LFFFEPLSHPAPLARLGDEDACCGFAKDGDALMKYALLIHEDETPYGNQEDDPAIRDIVARHDAFAGSLGAVMTGGAGLLPTATATTLRVRNGAQTLHDGPFAETKEQLGGFYIVDVPDLDAAIALARRIPTLGDASIEIRPLMAMD
jgi:hypothetical protein